MLKYIRVETKELEVYEKVVVAYSDEQALAQWNFPFDICNIIQIKTYRLCDFITLDNIIVKNRLNKMELTIESVADFKGVYEKWYDGIKLLTTLCLTLEEQWQEFEVEERVIRFANIEKLYEIILGAMIDENKEREQDCQ